MNPLSGAGSRNSSFTTGCQGQGLLQDQREIPSGRRSWNPTLQRTKGGAPGPAHATVPNSDPTPAVSAMASAPQNVTRIAPIVTLAPPAGAATPLRSARNTSEVPETRGINPAAGAMTVTK